VTESNDDIGQRVNVDIGKVARSKDEPISTSAGRKGVVLPSWTATVVVTVIVSVFSSVASIAVYDRFFAQKVVTANISKFVIDQRDLYFQGKIDKQQYINSLTNFIALLKSQPKNRVIILEDVVAANAEKLEPR
jgi:hypothetical protein